MTSKGGSNVSCSWYTRCRKQAADVGIGKFQKTIVVIMTVLLLVYTCVHPVMAMDLTSETGNAEEEAVDEATPYYCGFAEEHVHNSGGENCYYNFTYTCGKIAHTHFYLCETPPQYCNKVAHEHGETCYDENGVQICTQEEHLHMLACWINPESAGESTDSEGNFAGESQFHSNHFFRYQSGSHTISSYETGVFLLIPDSEYTENWVPNTRQWFGSSAANYLVAYCCDDRTTSSKNGENYDTYTLDESRFTNDAQQRKVAAIIGHSYPFLTAEEMRVELATAYEQGLLLDSNGNLVDVSDSVEADWIAATQWALWNTTTTYAAHAPENVDIDDYGADRPAAFPGEAERVCINPLTNPGYTDVTVSRQKLDAIKNWLCSLEEHVALKVEHYEPELIENEDGTMDLKVTVFLNRAIDVSEHTEFQLKVGELVTTLETLPVGESSFSMLLKDIKDETLTGARVYLNTKGKHMQAYFFDSQNYQDMIGGNWEHYEEDLSFDVGSVKIDISVHKAWQDGNPGNVASAIVQLYANGNVYGAPVELNAANGWTYVWQDLNQYDVFGTEIEYTIVETPIEGYYSHLTKLENGYEDTVTYTMWEAVETFEGDGEYIILSDYGALTASYFKERYYLNVSPVDVKVIEDSQSASVWKAVYDETSGGYTLENKQYSGQYINGPGNCISTASTPYYSADNRLYYTAYDGTKYYFRSFYSNGYQVYTKDAALGMSFKLYKRTNKTVPSKDINFLVTNVPITPEVEVQQLNVRKEWQGRNDNRYPSEAYVQLLQNGRPYGGIVTLNAENGWTYSWEELPKAVMIHGTNVEITYDIEEVAIADGYVPTITRSDDGFTFLIINELQNYTLPNTGGRGTSLYTFGGLGLIMASGYLVISKKIIFISKK